jgi:hypothetical protein
VRTIEGSGSAGINRVWWNLQDEPSTQIKLRTKPLYADWFEIGPEGWRSGGQRLSMVVPPGIYSVTLEVDGQNQTQRLQILKDPNSTGTEADIRVQVAMFSELREDYEEVTDMVNRIEWVRRQLYDLKAVLDDRGGAADVLEGVDELDEKLIAIEDNLVRLLTTGGGDGVRWAPKLAEELRYLSQNISNGDFRPTNQAREVQAILNERVIQYRGEFNRLFEEDVAQFNRNLLERNLAPLISDLD